MNTDKKVWDWRTHILHDGPDNATYKLLLLTLSCYMDSAGGSCFPSIKTLIKVTSLTKPTVIKYLKKARKDGWIKVSKHGFAGQRWARNEYTASLPKVVKEVDCLNEKAVNQVNEGGKSDKEGGKTDEKRRLNSLSTISPYTSSYISSENTYTREDLLKIYKIYPKQVARGRALQEIAKALNRIVKLNPTISPVKWLENKVRLFANSPKGKGKYVPNPATWFMEERYYDDPAEWQDKDSAQSNYYQTLPGTDFNIIQMKRKRVDKEVGRQ